jgi:hypothetical protein
MSVYLLCKNPIAGLNRLDFPFTPQIDYGQDIKHEIYGLTHTNYQPYAFTRSENPTINISCKFSAHTESHFASTEKALRFLRTYSKMNYGRKDTQRGLPPRILNFFAYGATVFNDVPVYISKFNMVFPEDIDYVTGTFDSSGQLVSGSRIKDTSPGVKTRDPRVASTNVQNQDTTGATTDTQSGTVVNNKQTYEISLPILFTVNISLIIQQNLHKTVNEFTLEKFATGELMTQGYV